ncbi:hypothetical protein Bca101_099207 [Brassica carinata]
MEAKSHCKVHYGDGGDEEDAELEEFYDYSSRSLSLFSPLSFDNRVDAKRTLRDIKLLCQASNHLSL